MNDLDRIQRQKAATRAELEAHLMLFQGAVYRNDADLLNAATTAAHDALQAHLDAIAASWAIAVRDAG
jgi:hypothetical protein